MPDTFLYQQAFASTGEIAGSMSHQDEALHPSARTSLVHAGRFLLVLDGITTNRRLDKVSGSLHPVGIQAPRDTLMPLLAFAGDSGGFFGLDYAWRFRWENSVTGEVSALSPLPDEKVNVGQETLPGSNDYIPGTAYLEIDVSPRPPGVDTVALFRNTSQGSVYYRHTAVRITTETTVQITDTMDDELLVSGETSGLRSSPSFAEGLMPPVCKAYQHANNRTYYYGQVRMGTVKNGNVAIHDLDTYVYPNAGGSLVSKAFIQANRVGQRFRATTQVTGGSTVKDSKFHRIVEVLNEDPRNEWHVYPAMYDDGWASVNTVNGRRQILVYYEILDDRDLRAVWQSDPYSPTQLDPLSTLYFGKDADDTPCLFAPVGGADGVVTRRGVYRVDGMMTEDPFVTVQVTPIADEGACGVHAACWTPFGLCYLHETKGPRVFDGARVMPLGGDGPSTEFPARSQWDALDRNRLDEAYLFYDEERHELVAASVFLAGSDLEVFLTYDPETGSWRGPHRGSRTAHGLLEEPGGALAEVSGDLYGALLDEDVQVLDVVDPTTHTTTGTLADVSSSGTVLLDASGVFDPESDERLRGCPVWVRDPATGTHYYSVVADVLSATELRLLYAPVDLDGNTGAADDLWTYGIGSTVWRVRTAHLDASEPIQPKKAERVRLRFERAGASSSAFTVGCATNADGSYTTEAGRRRNVDPSSNVAGDVKIGLGGVSFQLEIAGVARTGTPQIVGAVIDIDLRGGASQQPAVGT